MLDFPKWVAGCEDCEAGVQGDGSFCTCKAGVAKRNISDFKFRYEQMLSIREDRANVFASKTKAFQDMLGGEFSIHHKQYGWEQISTKINASSYNAVHSYFKMTRNVVCCKIHPDRLATFLEIANRFYPHCQDAYSMLGMIEDESEKSLFYHVLQKLDASWSFDRHCGLLLSGGNGNGKTTAAVRICTDILAYRPFCTVGMIGYTGIFSALQQVQGPDRMELLNRLMRCGVLLIDDLSSRDQFSSFDGDQKREAPYRTEVMTQVLDYRFSHYRPTIITTNLSEDELNKTVGVRLAGRIKESCIPIVFDGDNMRQM
jgi:DNA replication protein DnaC